MNQLIHKFLNWYVGDEIDCQQLHQDSEIVSYFLFSKESDLLVLKFDISKVDSNFIKLYRTEVLCYTIESYFNLNYGEGWEIVRDWFGKKFGLNKVGDIMKFVEQ